MSIETAHGAPRQPIIKGVEIEAGGYIWTMPPLNMRQVREYQDALKVTAPDIAADATKEQALEAMKTAERMSFDAGLNAIHAALSRNYPGLTLDDVLDIADASNFQAMLAAMNGVSGLVTSGEAPARSTLTA